MIKLTMEIKETDEQHLCAIKVGVDSDLNEATPIEKLTLVALRHVLGSHPATVGHGVGQTEAEATADAYAKSEIERAILAAGMPRMKGSDKPQ